jgi:hypothetical protein
LNIRDDTFLGWWVLHLCKKKGRRRRRSRTETREERKSIRFRQWEENKNKKTIQKGKSNEWREGTKKRDLHLNKDSGNGHARNMVGRSFGVHTPICRVVNAREEREEE